MNEIEERLRSYRKKEDREKLKSTIYSYWRRISAFVDISGFCDKHFKLQIFENVNRIDNDGASDCPEPLPDAELDNINVCNWAAFFLNVIIWCILFSLAVYVEFGVIYIIISGFYIIWVNTSTRPKYRNEISAYSVFNRNCEPIDGTLDAEKLQNQMLLGALH